MKKRTLLCVGIAALALTACQNGTKKCTYEEFAKEVAETAKGEIKEPKKVKINGNFSDGKTSYEAKNLVYSTDDTKAEDLTIKDMAFILVVGALSSAILTVTNDPDTTYYIGNGFRVKDTDVEMSWDENLNITYAKGTSDGAEMNIKVSYTY